MNHISPLMGAIAGDTIGSIYEFNPTKDYNFQLLQTTMDFTDDSILTIAIADWLTADPAHSQQQLFNIFHKWVLRYPNPMGSYGTMFIDWISSNNPRPYNSWGNGSAMRISSVGWAFSTLNETLRVAKIATEITHNHPEGIKGAQATAAAIFLARTGHSKQEIKDYITQNFHYDLTSTCSDIRPNYQFESSCQHTVPQSLIAFFDSHDFESAIRLAVSLGGDADTMGAITGAVALAFYNEMPQSVTQFLQSILPNDMKQIITKFNHQFPIKPVK